ncbi:uncharacterized protein [Physcomitrium patens]|uniref:uncharacterized protein isoform X2 n=1 Tax=Physcomitrium patens TaxID=3218 RepID=UPI00024AF843|nr:ADP-ribosylation factor 1-like isoform X2 [Physcomitrium patens]|eukprot:XP_024384624.1 ADP-ribosylation factor 1-like isoform X2 [Physcomitrella patens]
MGIYFGKLLDSTLWGTKTHKILMVGLDSAGKTTILYQLKLGREVVTIPTIGYNVETIELGNINLSVWDLGGWTNNPFWIYYLPDAVRQCPSLKSPWHLICTKYKAGVILCRNVVQGLDKD